MEKQTTKKTVDEKVVNNQENISCPKEKILAKKWFKRIFSTTITMLGIVLTVIFWMFPNPFDSKKPFIATIQITNWEETFLPTLELDI